MNVLVPILTGQTAFRTTRYNTGFQNTPEQDLNIFSNQMMIVSELYFLNYIR